MTTRKLPRARAILMSDPEYPRLMAERAANAAADNARFAAGETFWTELGKEIKSLRASEPPPELQPLANAMQEHGPAIALAMFDRLFPQFDLEVSLNAVQ